MTLKPQSRKAKGRPLRKESLSAARDLVRSVGENEAARILGVSRNALYRALAGMSVLAGTELLIERGLASARGGQRNE